MIKSYRMLSSWGCLIISLSSKFLFSKERTYDYELNACNCQGEIGYGIVSFVINVKV